MLLNIINHFETPPQSPDLMPIEMVSLNFKTETILNKKIFLELILGLE